jgi:hypothetical protein
MTDKASAGLAWVPQACTLPTAEQPLRLAEFDALFIAAARGGERLGAQHLRVFLNGGAEVEETVRDLAARETQCCSFFTFTVTAAEPGLVHLDIEVPAGRIEVLDALEARTAAVRART